VTKPAIAQDGKRETSKHEAEAWFS